MRQYKFIGEFGERRLKYREYLKDIQMRKRMNDPERLALNLGLNILTYDRGWLEKHEEEGAKVRSLVEFSQGNPLMFFLPMGAGQDMLNDRVNDVKMMIAPNRTGKTAHMVVDILLDIVPTDAEWPIFKEHGVKFRKWYGPKIVGIATYNWTMMQRTLWPEVKKWLPKYELGEYAVRDIPWRIDPSVELRCGSKIYMFVYEQAQDAYESQALDIWGWDEQGEEPKFDGGDERLRTRRGRHIFALTPHKVEGRPDTGAHSWINKMASGESTKGHKVAKYTISVAEVPDWIYPEEAKKEAYEKWVLAPRREKNVKAQKEGEARYFGRWHESGGLVYDEWDDAIHLVDPFQIPDTWTRYRGIDHGVNNPTCCLFAAVSPEGDIYFYREYFREGLTISENCKNIILASGNEWKTVGAKTMRGDNVFYERIMEIPIKEKFRRSVLDSRSMGTPQAESQLTVGQLYQINGLRVQPASGKATTDAVSIVKECLRIDPERVHPRTSKKGAPRLFVFRDMPNFRREIRNYIVDEYKSIKTSDGHNIKETPVGKNDHAMSAMMFICLIPPRYVFDRWAFYEGVNSIASSLLEEKEWQEDREDRKRTRFCVDAITGY